MSETDTTKNLSYKLWAVITDFPDRNKAGIYNYERESKGGSLCIFRTRKRAKEVSTAIPFSRVVRCTVELDPTPIRLGRRRNERT